MPSSVYEEEINLNDLLLQQIPVEAAPLATQIAIPLHASIDEIVKSITPQPVQEVVSHVFTELARLLNYLQLIEDVIKQDKTLQRTTILFKLINEKAQSFLSYINAHTALVNQYDEELRETLDSINFAISHELYRVYKVEVPAINSSAQSLLSRAELTWVYGLLHNCFQQSTITLVQTFNPSLEGSHLFDDYKIKLEQSIMLHRELSELLRLAGNAEKATGLLLRLSFINRLQAFHNETMHFLMYRDWDTFEKFVDEIMRTYNSMEDLAPTLHRFARYVETLLRHVGMRGVLINHQKI